MKGKPYYSDHFTVTFVDRHLLTFMRCDCKPNVVVNVTRHLFQGDKCTSNGGFGINWICIFSKYSKIRWVKMKLIDSGINICCKDYRLNLPIFSTGDQRIGILELYLCGHGGNQLRSLVAQQGFLEDDSCPLWSHALLQTSSVLMQLMYPFMLIIYRNSFMRCV